MKPDWKDAPEWAEWLAQDCDGLWFWYSGKPDIGPSKWIADSAEVDWSKAADDFPNIKWQKTLEARPSGIETPEEKEELDRVEKQLIGDNKYTVKIKGIPVDVYDVLKAFNVTNPGDQHAIKKMLKAGQRGYKDANQDREEAIASLNRAIELDSDDEM